MSEQGSTSASEDWFPLVVGYELDEPPGVYPILRMADGSGRVVHHAVLNSYLEWKKSQWQDPDRGLSADELLTVAMNYLGSLPNTIFLGQGVEYGGVATHKHLQGVPVEKRLEFPVAEELQLGVSIGLSLQGFLPISVFPRVNFLWRAADQLINHLDKLEQMSQGQFRPKLIIRTRVGATEPLNAGPQHTGNPINALKGLIPNVELIDIWQKQDILKSYTRAVESRYPVIVLEDLGC